MSNKKKTEAPPVFPKMVVKRHVYSDVTLSNVTSVIFTAVNGEEWEVSIDKHGSLTVQLAPKGDADATD